MHLKLIGFLIILSSVAALANNCTTSTTGNFQTAASWIGCGSSFPGAGDTATITGVGVVVTIPLGETDFIGTTGGTTPHPVLTVSGGAGLVILGTLTAGNQSGVQTNDIEVTGSGSFILNRGTFNQQGDLDLDTSAEWDACAGGIHAVVSSGTTVLNRITGTGAVVPYPLWNMHSTRCASYGGAIPSSPVGVPCTDAGGGANCYHMQVPAGTAFQWGNNGAYLVFDANSLVFDSPNNTYGTCGKSNAICFQGVGFWCRNTSFNFTGQLNYFSYGIANDPGLDWSADAYGQGCDVRNPLGTVGLYCSATTNPGTYQGKPSPRRIEWATFDVDAGEHNQGNTNSICPGLDINNIVSSAEFGLGTGGTQFNTNYHDMLFLRAYNFIDTYVAYFLPGAGLTYTNIGALAQGPKSVAHSHMFSEAPPAGASFGLNFTTCNTYKNLFFEGAGDQIAHDNQMVNSTCIRYQGGIFDHNFTNFIDNNNAGSQCNSCNSSGAEHVTIVDNNNPTDITATGFQAWEVQGSLNRLGINKVEEINSFLAQSVTNVIGHEATTYSNNTVINWTEQPAYGSANITSVVVTNPNMTINVDSSTPFQSSTHGQVQLISLNSTIGAGTNQNPGNCTVGTILQINSGNNDATFQNTSAASGPITSYAIVTPGTGYINNRYSTAYTTTVVSGGTCTTGNTPIVTVATGDVWARLGCTMQTGYGIQSTAATVLNCHHFFVTSTTSTSITGAIPPGVTIADGTYTTTGIVEKGFNYDYNIGGDWQARTACGTPNLWNTAAGGTDGIPFGDPNIATSCNWVSFGTFNASTPCNNPCTSLSANAITAPVPHPFAVNQVVIDRTTNGTTTALITAVSGSGPYTLTLGPNNQTGAAGLPFTINTSDVLVLMQGIWDSTAPAFGTATHYGSHDVSASPQLAYSSFTPGKITGVTLTAGGTGYVQGNVYFLSGGTDPGAITATTVSSGVITAATLAYGGSGYSSGQTLTVQGGGNNATVQTLPTNGVQASCNLATWDKSIGGVGSWANAKKMLIAMNGHDQAGNTVVLNPEYNLQNFFAYKAECYKFYNTALNGKGAQGTDPGFAPNAVDPVAGKITDNYILVGSTHNPVNGAGENTFTNQAGQVHIGGHGQLTLSSAPRICADTLDPCTALTVSPVVLAGQYYHFTANGPAAITWSVSGDTNSSITPQTGVYTRTGTPTGTITVTATNLNGSSSIVVSPSGLPTPTFSLAGGTYIGTQSVIITIASGATGCYTIDGTTPTATAGTCTNGTTYSSPVSVTATLTLKAIATESGFSNSLVASASYVIVTQVYVTVVPLPAAKVGILYTTTLTATGGTGTYTWTLLGSTPLPAGLSLSSGGVISGTPTDGGTFTKTTSFGVTATDVGLSTNTGGAPFIIIVLPATYSAPGIPQNQFTTGSSLTLAGNLAQYITWWPLHLTYYSGSAGGNNIAPSGLPDGHFWDIYVDGANNYASEIYPSEYAAADDNGWNPEISFLHNPVDYETTGYNYFSNNMGQFDAWERTYAVNNTPNDNSLLNSVNGIFNCPATGACTDVTIPLYCPADAPFGVTDCNSYTPVNTTVVDHLIIGKQLPIYLINVNVVTPLSGGTVAYQYWNGSAYVSIPGVTDGTSGLTTSGQITFSPPSDWVRNVDGGTYKKFHVRVQLSGSSPSVVLSRVWGDNMLAVAKTASLTGIAITTSVTGTNPQTVILTAPATNTFSTAGPPYVQLSGLTNSSLSVLNGYWGYITAASGTSFTMSLSVPSTVGAVVSACSSPCTESGSSAVVTYYKNRGWNPSGCTAGHVNAGTEVEYCGTPSTTGTAKLPGEGRIILNNYKTYLGNHVAFANGKYVWAVSKLYQANWVLAKEAQPPQNGVSWDDGGQNLAWLNYSTTEYGSTPWGSLTPSQADGIFYPQLYLLMKQNHPTFSNMPNSTNRALQFFYTMGMDIGHYEDTNHMSNGTTLDTDSALASCPDSIWCHSSAYNIGTTITNYEGTTTTQWHIGQYPGVRMVARSWDALQLYAFSDNQLPAASETVANYHVTDMDTEAIAAFAGYLMIKNPNVYFTYDPASYGTGHVDGADDYYYWVTSSSTLQTALSPQLCLTGTSPCTISLSGNITPSAMACPGVGKPTTITTSQCPIRIGGKGGDVISVPITGNNYPACSSGSPCTVAVAFSACSVYYNCPAIVQSHVTGSTIEYMVKALQSTQVGPYPTSSIAQWGYHIPISDVYLGIPDPANGYDAPCRNDVYYKVGSNPGFTGFPHKYRLQDCELANFQTYVPNYPALCDITGTISTNGFCSQIVRRDFKQGTYGNAIVLYRPANSTTDGSVRTATAEYDTLSNPIPLGGTFYALNTDGTVGTTPITAVQLKARQAFIGVTQTGSSSTNISSGFSLSGGGVIR